MRVAAYIDGFSFYYSCFSGRTKGVHAHLKWLNYRLLCENLFPADSVSLVRYFTAIAPSPPHDPDQANRHSTYIRALRTILDLHVHVGSFSRSKREVLLVRPPAGVSVRQTAFVTQEKKSDVLLASHFLIDSFSGSIDSAVLLTNDSDFVPAIELVRQVVGIDVGVISPDRTVGKELSKTASFAHVLDKGLLFTSQLPNPVVDAEGNEIRMPDRWQRNRHPADG